MVDSKQITRPASARPRVSITDGSVMGTSQESNLSWLHRRELGSASRLGNNDSFSRMLYSSVDVQGFWDPATTSSDGSHGGIFNFDFATDGSVLVAACERSSFLVFDPRNCKLLQSKSRAHSDCVNCVRFLDTRSFVTCSDDTNVVLWDLRYLKSSVRTFQGHSNWVKNIEYASSLGLLVTSGFDGAVYTWNINNYSKEEECKRVFYIEGLMRCKLTPDDSKLVISTSRGYILLVHDLDLPRLEVDMNKYKHEISVSRNFNALFTRRKNRLEIVNDFPDGDKAEVVASLQVHPQGWCVASRNTTADEATEWTCVHDIHSQPLCLDGEELEDHNGLFHSLLVDPGGYGSPSPPSSPPSSPPRHSSARTDPPAVPGGDSSSSSNITCPRPGLNTSSGRFHVALRRYVRAARAGGSRDAEPDPTAPPPGAGNSAVDPSVSSDEEDLSAELYRSSSSYVVRRSVAARRRRDAAQPFFRQRRLHRQGSGYSRHTRNRQTPPVVPPPPAATPPPLPLAPQPPLPVTRLPMATLPDTSMLDTDVYNYFMWTQRPRPFNWSAAARIRNHADLPGEATISGNLSVAQRERAARYIAQRLERQRAERPLDLRTFGSIRFFRHTLETNGRNGAGYKSKPRLIYGKQEPNVGRGFIKEQCFSTDGRLIVSPWGNGVRLLAFDEQCRELCDCEAPETRQGRSLHELRKISMHPQVVLTSKYSPTHPLFVTGGRDGSVAFLTPNP